MAEKLSQEGFLTGRFKAGRLMKEAGDLFIPTRKFRLTTDSRHNLPVSPNLPDRDFHVEAPTLVWVSDITTLHDGHFTLAESSEVIEKSCRRLIVELEEEISFAPSGENIVGLSILGKRLELLLKNCSDDMVPEQLKGLKVKSYQIEKLSLKELFLGLTRN